MDDSKPHNAKNYITVLGAREHNLKNISVAIPKDTLTVITGPSGSGKSTLALDILYAEGQRRYIESLSSYARQFLGNPKKPDVDAIHGLCPSIAIDQKTVGANPRSTVGTITEIYDYFRVLFARIGRLHCPECGQSIEAASPEKIAALIEREYVNQVLTITAPIAVEKKGEFTQELVDLFRQGYYRFIIDGKDTKFTSLEQVQAIRLAKTFKHTIDLIIDRIEIVAEERTRLFEALEKAFALTKGLCKVVVGERSILYSSQRMCVTCGVSFPEIEPRFFSFNSPLGACTQCHGLGIAPEALLREGEDFAWAEWRARSICGDFPCAACKGQRLHPLALAVKVGDKNIFEIGQLSVLKGLAWLEHVTLSEQDAAIAQRLLQEIKNRYMFLRDVGLGYLSLNRTARTLSGGEGQRIRLATQIGSALSGVLYILDEPSIGLHQRDNERLIATLHALRDQGNTVVVVEHDHDTMLSADYLIDMGPAAGVLGGQITAHGTPQSFVDNPRSLTGDFLSGKRSIGRVGALRKPHSFVTLHHANANNLKDLTVEFPLGVLCGISGVSGSGKSSLIMQEFVPALTQAIAPATQGGRAGQDSDRLTGAQAVEALVVIDQSPIGRTSRSNPATYLGIFDEIRALFASLPESNARGYQVGRFSFNVHEGRCRECMGNGSITVSMHFLPDVTMVCSSCKGSRYNQQTLDIKYKGKHIADILSMTAREALTFFAAHRRLEKRLQLLCDVGLDYLQLGQDSTTLSGGEAQRIKLVDELAKRGSKTVYILDEPTTGLHAADIERLLEVFSTLVQKGNSLFVIEHNLEVLKTADYLIDLGPEGGDEGGTIVATGTPQEVARVAASHTGRYLKKIFAGSVQHGAEKPLRKGQESYV
jgi:excinuclease ABC subunit A